MKSFKMKALAVATLGLGGLVMAGSAFAACPTIPATSSSPGGGGAWTSQTVTAMAFGNASSGLNSTSCALQISVNNGAASNAKGFVTDASPQNESHYRARFYVNTAGLTNATVANRQFRIFSALAVDAPSDIGAEMVSVSFIGGTTPSFRFFVGDTSIPGYKIASAAAPNTGGNYRIEFDLQQGNPGTFRYWVSDASAVTTDGTPTGTVSVTNPQASDGSGWSGVKQANLGLFITSPNFRANVATQPLIVDEFDSRRQTFIGK